jgi:hypothetical protein
MSMLRGVQYALWQICFDLRNHLTHPHPPSLTLCYRRHGLTERTNTWSYQML